MSNGVEKHQPMPIAEVDQWAQKLYDSGMFKDVKDVAEAAVKIVAGAELGLLPTQSMRGVHVIAGKTVIGAGLLSSLLDRPPYDFTTKFEPNIENPTSCTITVFKNGVERGQSYFSLEQAKRIGLVKPGGNWEKYPSDMLFARAVSQAARRYAAGALGGAVYVEAHGEYEIQPEAPPPTSKVVATVIPYVDPDDPLDDVPFEEAAPAEPDAEPIEIINTLEEAQRIVNALDGPQLGVMKRMLGISEKTTRRLLADALLEQRRGRDIQDVLAMMAGWPA